MKTQKSQVDSKNLLWDLHFSDLIRVHLKDRGCEFSLSRMLFTGISMDKSSVLFHRSFIEPAPDI